MPIKNRHGIRPVADNVAFTFDEFTAVIVYHTGIGDLEASPDGGTTWFTLLSYTGTGATSIKGSASLMRCTANATHVEGLRGVD